MYGMYGISTPNNDVELSNNWLVFKYLTKFLNILDDVIVSLSKLLYLAC